MIRSDIIYPSLNHKMYIEKVYGYCSKNNLAMLMKGSLANNTSTKYSDIDLIVVGEDLDEKIDELILIHGKPVMINFTENPKGIVILIYEDGLSIDLDVRKTISSKELNESKILLDVKEDFIVSNEEVLRYDLNSNLDSNKPLWYRVLRLIHKGTAKYLSNKTESAYNFLLEIKENLIDLEICDLRFDDSFEGDIQIIFNEICNKFRVNIDIQKVFKRLFDDFNIIKDYRNQ
ncbi:MAG: DNA polymerase III subunit beta [Firmicutes bacterium]|nr:DNA polymerase III subunit beta [Bacillota bacterium]